MIARVKQATPHTYVGPSWGFWVIHWSCSCDFSFLFALNFHWGSVGVVSFLFRVNFNYIWLVNWLHNAAIETIKLKAEDLCYKTFESHHLQFWQVYREEYTCWRYPELCTFGIFGILSIIKNIFLRFFYQINNLFHQSYWKTWFQQAAGLV